MIFFDFEVFKYDWLVVLLDMVNKEKTVIVNDRDALEKYYTKHKSDIWIGFNVRNYDQFILKSILCDFNPKDVNDFIIVKGQKGYQYSKLFNKVPLNFFDVMPNPPIGLKALEGFMGSDIRETTVPFDIDRKLTPEELEDVIFYCNHDVEQTAMVFGKRLEEFTSQLELVKMFEMPRSDMGKTKAQLSAKALGAERPSKPRKDELEFVIPNTLRVTKYKHVVDWFIECRDRALWNISQCMDYDTVLKEFYEQKLECEVAGVPHVFAWGGLHGAIPNYVGNGYFVNVDVASFYPSLMIEYDYISRNIHDPDHYKNIYRTRLAYKKAKDKRANPLKIVLNSTYGAMKDKYNQLYDPRQANNVCVAGQLLLLDLMEHVEKAGTVATVIQSNTDGVLFKLCATTEDEADKAFAALDDLCREWEQRTRMTLEFDEFVRVVQRDVNNYLIVDAEGKYKSKGAVVKKLNDLDYDLPIVNRAVVNYLVKGVPVERTVNECNDLREFQKIYKVSGLYKYAMHNGQKLSERTFRVFASKRDSDTPLYKVKDKPQKDGTIKEVPEKFASCPEHCFIDNSEVAGKPVPDYLNRDWYIAEAKERIKGFLGEK